MTTRQYARLLSEWIASIGLDPHLFGTHSLRRTKATLIYRRTGNLRAVQLLLGHCVYRKPKPAHNGDEGRQGPRVVSNFAHPRAVTARLDRSEPHAEHCTSARGLHPVSYTHLRAHETRHDLVCRLLLEKKKKNKTK